MKRILALLVFLALCGNVYGVGSDDLPEQMTRNGVYNPYGSDPGPAANSGAQDSADDVYGNANQNVTYNQSGSNTVGSDGSSFHRFGNVTVGSDGKTYTNVGNTMMVGNDGTTYTSAGGATYGSNGSSYASYGNTSVRTDKPSWER